MTSEATPAALPQLARALRTLLRTDLPSRPFVADGSPFDSDIAIVGIDPGTSTPFWEHWSDESGFDRDGWISADRERPNAKRNATRNRIERLVRALHPLRVVELNAYPYATRTESEIAEELKDARVLHPMLRVAKPRAVFLFGKAPARVFASLLGIAPLDPGTVRSCEYDDRPLQVFAEPHLSRS